MGWLLTGECFRVAFLERQMRLGRVEVLAEQLRKAEIQFVTRLQQAGWPAILQGPAQPLHL